MPQIITRSPLAHMIAHPQDVRDRSKVQAYGVVVHTTGSGVPIKAKQRGITPAEEAIAVYAAPGAYCPHHVIDYVGTIYQIADEKEKVQHAGIDSDARPLYVDGSWVKKVSPSALAMWKARWSKPSPLFLFPGVSVNDVYLGIEMIPLLAPATDGSLFTGEQYKSLSNLLHDIEKRHGIDLFGTHLPNPRLLGHEDISPLDRWNSGGGWDPGSLRTAPSFLWGSVV